MLISIYATSFYGSGNWDIFSKECEKLYASWNVTIRMVFNLDRCTHRYLIESISNCLHPKVMLASRYVTFYRSLVTWKKFGVRFLARIQERDNRTLESLMTECEKEVLLHECTWCWGMENTFACGTYQSQGQPISTWEPELCGNQEPHRPSLCLIGRYTPWAISVGCFFPWASQFLPPTSQTYSSHQPVVPLNLLIVDCVQNKVQTCAC